MNKHYKCPLGHVLDIEYEYLTEEIVHLIQSWISKHSKCKVKK